MQHVLGAFLQMMVLTAIVATLVYLPACIVLALALYAIGISLETWLTLGGTLHPALGILAWWLLIFVGAFGYVAWQFPWENRVFGWPGRE